MSLPHAAMWAVVLAIGLPSAWRNPTAGALVLCWVFAEGLFWLTGNGLATDYYIFPDVFTLAVIFAKPAACNFQPYRNTYHQFICIVLERSVPDRIVMLIFPVMWWLYASRLDPYHVWWSLYWLAMVQFAAAGWESFAKFRRAYKAVSDAPDAPTSDSQFRFACGGGGYG